MNDTNLIVEQQFREMMLGKSNEERLMMGFSMFDAAKALVIASIRHTNPSITTHQLREELFLRYYGSDFPDDQKKKILQVLNSSH